MLNSPLYRGLFFPPGVVPKLRSAHPAAGLVKAFYLFGPNPVAIVPGFGGLSVKTGTPVPTIGRTGLFSSFSTTSGFTSYQATSGPSGDTSVVVVAMRSVTPGSAGYASMVPLACGTTNVTGTRFGIEFAIGNAWGAGPDQSKVVIQVSNGGGSYGPDAIWVDGVRESTASPLSAAPLTNGRWYCIGTTVTALPAGNAPLHFGEFPDGIFGLDGGLQAAIFFNGVLSDGFMSALTLNPAGLLEWPGDELLILAANISANNWVESISDVVTLVDSILPARSASVSISDTFSLVDSLTAHSAIVIGLADTVSLADSLVPVRAASAAFTDTTILADSLVAQQAASLSLSDNVSVSDSVLAVRGAAVAIADTLTLSDSFTATAAYNVALSDTLYITDAVSARVDGSVAFGDTLTFSDVVRATSTGTGLPSLMGAPLAGPLINVGTLPDMEDISVDELMGDPEFMAYFRVRRIRETVNDFGRVETSSTTFDGTGSFQPATGLIYAQFPEMTRVAGDMELYTRTRLTQTAPGYQGDLVDFEGQTYVVRGVVPWRGYGQGYQIALLGLRDLLGPRISDIGPPPGTAGIG